MEKERSWTSPLTATTAGIKISSQLPRHLKDCYAWEKDVIQMLLVKNNGEKQKAAQVLHNLGNNHHNAQVIWKGKGELIVARAPSDDSEWDSRTYAPCDLCFSWFKEDELYRHICLCKAPGCGQA
jgi:hypothetical protein